MNYKQIFIITLIVIGLFDQVKGQTTQRKTGSYATNDFYANLKPGDQEHAALGSYGNTAINYYAGLPEVSLPLLTLSSRDISLPISINYDATGVRVSDIAGPVGLKWNLNTGGYVARQMNGGYPDEDPSKGYWLYESSINGVLTKATQISWITDYEQNNRDFEPDEFVLFVNGRSTKFIIRNGVAVAIPRQNVNITYTSANGKIYSFQFVDEGGTTYAFGGSTTSIGEQKIETLNLSLRCAFDQLTDQNNTTFNIGNSQFEGTYTHTPEKQGQFYNDKWYLISITSPTGDQITFNYSNDGYQKHVTTPVVTRIDNAVVNIPTYSYTKNNNTVSVNNVVAYSTFSQDCLDVGGIGGCVTSGTLDPQTSMPQPGGTFVSQSLITESVIRLTGISTSAGNRVALTSSSRSDMPVAYKYDQIDLYNMSNQLIKSIKFSYSIVNADISQDYLWLSEGILASRIYTPGGNLPYNENGDQDYYAHHFNNLYSTQYFTPASINSPLGEGAALNALLLKYAFEGLNDYNFQRLFLENVVEVTNAKQKTLYSFVYNNRTLLRRRTTPMQDESGFPINYNGTFTLRYPGNELPILVQNIQGDTGRAMIIKAYIPNYGGALASTLYGILTQINYPTGGKTVFNFTNGPILQSISDKDENDAVTQTRELSYLEPGYFAWPQTTTFKNVWDQNKQTYFQIQVTSSAAQNRTYRPSSGVYATYKSVKAYNGSAANNKGYEIFNYSVDPDYSSAINLTLEGPGTPTDTQVYTDIFPFPKSQEQDHLRGMLKEHFVYDINNNLVKYTKNEYQKTNFNYNPVTVQGFFGGSFSFNGGPTKYRYGRYVISADWTYLMKTTEKTYDQSVPQDTSRNISIITEYSYDPNQLQLISTKTYNRLNKNSYVQTNTKYATHSDYAATGSSLPPDADAIVGLKNSHQINSPVEVQNWIQEGAISKLTSAVVYKYTKEGSPQFIKPKEVWGLKQPLDASSFNTSYIDANAVFKIDNQKMRKLHTYDIYDQASAKLKQQTSLDGTVTAFTWGFNNSLVQSVTVNPGTIQQSTNYDYFPSVGITTLLDPNLMSTTYTYDQYNRLRLIKDSGGNIQSRYRYHYIGQDEFISAGITSSCATVGNPMTFSCPDNPEFGQTTYTWNFGDGTAPVTGGSVVTHAYSSAGTYTVLLKKNNPEQFASDVTTTVSIGNTASVSICADGPIVIDRCGISSSTFGSCTTNFNSSATTLRATANNTINGLHWQYQTGDGNWLEFGTLANQSPPSGFQNHTVGTYTVRCIGYDICGTQIISSTLTLVIYKSANCA